MAINLTQNLAPRRDPFAEFDALIRHAFPTDRLVGARARTVRPVGAGDAVGASGVAPAAEVVRSGDDALIRLELPGLDLERDVNVELDGRRLVVRGERRDEFAETSDESGDEDSQTQGHRVIKEIRYGSFERTFTLPEHVTAEALSAAYDAGVLTVRVAGAYAGTEPQRIAVRIGK